MKESGRIILSMKAKINDQEMCKKAMEAIVEAAHAEPATKSHWWCVSEDGESLHVLEQYDDAAGAIAHINANPPARSDFFASIEVVNLTAYCDLTDELKELLAPLKPTFMKHYGGFSK